ncbi:MmgE/PrpD family protein [Halalkalibacter krulwichiae]|uniref:MmgE/PrpD family protein n=1 Tax=Halalkalibacter krulwichiae TaxID=199441 RepID=A0A1X9MCV8_9BACI|nr:MmgE/PrpD family protein [Halalkalibacter krulwichiae]ARK29973.1 MmgE/PrpD family protein [Halalkalibacter krulwichiae]
MSFTHRIAEFSVGLKDQDITEEVREQIKKVYLDYLTAAISGSQTEVGKKVYEYYSELGKGESTVLGQDTGLNYHNAAFVNGTSAHCLDFDDGHTKGSVHIGCVIFPAVLAVAEKNNSSVQQVIRAILVGYEVTIRVASVIHPYSRQRGFHNTSVAGIFGVTAAISHLLEFNFDETVGALGNAASFAGGTFAFLGSGSEVKRLHPGIAARDGIIAAELSKRKLYGPSDIFEKEGGVFDVFAGGQINNELAELPIGRSFEILNIYIKPYPCCRHLHVVIDAIKEIQEQHHISPTEIKKVKIGVNKVTSFHSHKECNSLLDLQMSIPFVAAVALLGEEITVDSFNLERTDYEEIRKVMETIDVVLDEDCERVYPLSRKTNIVIYLQAGQSIEISFDTVKGSRLILYQWKTYNRNSQKIART